MSHVWPLRVIAQAGIAGLAVALGGCLSAPQGPTSAGAIPPTGGNVSINAVAQRYIEESHFKRISEYFTNTENKGGNIIERTDPQQRTGYYFIVDLDWRLGVVIPAGTKAVLDYIRADNPAPRQAVFTFSTAASTWSEIFLGLTGADWPSATTELVAYRLRLETADGQLLAEHKSFLWDMPAGKVDHVAADAGANGAGVSPAATPADSAGAAPSAGK
jgi:hypothetical protein